MLKISNVKVIIGKKEIKEVIQPNIDLLMVVKAKMTYH
jgi:hypothetical protein